MNQKIATWVGTVILIIIAVTAGTFVWIAQKNNPIETASPQTVVKNANNQTPAAAVSDLTDSDAQAINNDLNSVNDDDFSSDKLSDQNVGL